MGTQMTLHSIASVKSACPRQFEITNGREHTPKDRHRQGLHPPRPEQQVSFFEVGVPVAAARK